MFLVISDEQLVSPEIAPRFLCLKSHLLQQKWKWHFNDHGKWNHNLYLISCLFFFNELLMQAFFPPVDRYTSTFSKPSLNHYSILSACQWPLPAGLINLNISSRTICVKKFCFNAITENSAASSVTHHFTHVQIYCRVHYQICVQWMVVWQLASFLPSFYCSFKDWKMKKFPASLAARVLDVNWVLPSGILVNI